MTRLVGRQAEQARLASLLDSPGLVTLVGAGGAGKTRLALEVAARLGPGFTDGAWLIDLSVIRDGEQVVELAMGTLGIKDQPGRSGLDSLVAWARSRRALLMVDNCEHVRSAAGALLGALAAAGPGGRLLATSREPLGVDGERMLELEPLRLPERDRTRTIAELAQVEAVELLVERAAVARPGFRLDADNQQLVVNLVRRLDGLPLALELAAARLRWLPLESLVASLDQRLRVLAGASPLRPERHHTVTALVDWSYGQIEAGEQVVLRRLAVLAGSFPIAAAVAVGAGYPVPESEVPGRLALLRQRSLVAEERGARGVRYRLLETVRAFAGARLEQSGEAVEARRSLAAHHAELAAAAATGLLGVEQVAWFERLHDEHDNLRAALDACREVPGLAPTGVRLAADLGGYFLWRGLLAEGMAALEGAIERAGEVEPGARARAHDLAGKMAFDQGLSEVAERHFLAALALGRQSGALDQVASASTRLGALALVQADLVRSRRLHGTAIVLALKLDDRRVLARALQNLSQTLEMGRDPAGSVLAAEACLGLFIDLEDRREEASARSSLAFVLTQHGEFGPAERLQQEALELRRALGDEPGIGNCLLNLGQLAGMRGDLEACGRFTREAIAILGRVGHTEHLMLATNNLAEVYLAQGNLVGSRRHFVAALELCRVQGLQRFLPSILQNLMSLEEKVGRYDRVATFLGLIAALRRAWGLTMTPSERTLHDAAHDAARRVLGEAGYERCRERGDGFDLARAWDYVLSDEEEGTGSPPGPAG